MRIKLGVITGLTVFTLFALMIVPTYADVTSLSMKKTFYTIDESISFVGTEDEGNAVINIVVRDPNGKATLLGGFSDSQGQYETIPKTVKSVFSVNGIYNVTAFTDKIENNKSLQVEFNGDRVDLIPDFVLTLNSISDKTVEAKKTLVFTASLTESVADAIFSLEDAPTGASINSETGKFTWTPTEPQSPGSYVFDVVVKKGASEDRESVKIAVTKPVVVTQPEPQPTPEPTTELGIASFVDPTKDPQSYVDRYNNEPTYKKWFDTNFPQYSSIYEAVGLAEPEITKPETVEEEIGQCGPGTTLVGDTCEVVNNTQKGGGCLIATAAYGSEMAPQVQFLREIRDDKVMSTASGASFMTAFNNFYYSFSPTVADLERENPIFKEVVKIGITPMLSSLSIMSAADSEQEILTYGIGVILMNVGMYFAAPVMIFYSIKKAKTRLSF